MNERGLDGGINGKCAHEDFMAGILATVGMMDLFGCRTVPNIKGVTGLVSIDGTVAVGSRVVFNIVR